MSEQRDVPPWALALVVALRDIGYALRRHGEDFENGQHDGLLQRRGGELESICRAVLATASNSDAGTGERVPRYVCRACDFTTNYEKLSQEHHDATGHNMRWTGREATSEELAHDIRGTAPASGAAPEPDKCAVCKGSGTDLASDPAHWLPCSSCRGTGKPSEMQRFEQGVRDRTPPAAPEERDGELNGLLEELTEAHEQYIRGAGEDEEEDSALRGRCRDAVAAIHAHVAQVKREAREGKCCERDYDGDGNCDIHSAPGKLRNAALSAPASGDASGETRLGDLLDHMLAEHGAVISPTEMSRDERCAHVVLRDSYKADILRLYRAATGEVVADFWLSCNDNGNTRCWQVHPPKRDEDAIVGVVWLAATDGTLYSSVPPMLASLVPPPGKCEYFVVLRRDKEEGRDG